MVTVTTDGLVEGLNDDDAEAASTSVSVKVRGVDEDDLLEPELDPVTVRTDVRVVVDESPMATPRLRS